jgi:hypothetical protein
MFCPECRTEYRAGFTKCSDCGVNLVPTLQSGRQTADMNIPRNSEGMELLWSGVSEALTDQIDTALEAAHISHKIMDKEFGLLPNLEQSANFVWIDSRDRASSRVILEKVLAGSGALEQESERYPPDGRRMNPLGLGRKIYPSDDGNSPLLPNLLPDSPFDTASLFGSGASRGSNEPTPDDIVEDFDPDEATCEVWSGEDSRLAAYLNDCLRGVGIACIAVTAGTNVHVLVLPNAETRAREIVREVVEGAPPE